jgi:hypothetical protein
MSNVIHLKHQDTRSKAISTLKMMLDYAIVEGAELRLPVFVRLINLGRQELIESTKGDQQHMENTPSELN